MGNSVTYEFIEDIPGYLNSITLTMYKTNYYKLFNFIGIEIKILLSAFIYYRNHRMVFIMKTHL